MGLGDGSVLGATKIFGQGSNSNPWTMVLVAEGYKDTQMTQFHTDAQSFANTLIATAPFDTLLPAINIYRLDVTSTDSGADDPAACGGTGAAPATFFDASFCNSGNLPAPIRRLLLVNEENVITAVSAHVSHWDMIMVLVNSTIYGGSGGTIAVFSMAQGANEIGIHEMGHTAFRLADEYDYWQSCATDVGHDNHPAQEPSQPNVTIDSARATIKWGNLVLASTPMPTTSNANCAVCDPQPNPFSADTVGAYEGADYYHCDAFRPQFNCRMRKLGHPFCAVCRREIVLALTLHLPSKTVSKDIKDVEKQISEGLKLKDAEIHPWGETALAERLSRLEGTIAGMAHFITREQRPDLGRGALRGEADTPREARTSQRASGLRRRPVRKRRST
jgi:IgA Peptidase M64